MGTFISVFTYLSDRVIHFCRNTGLPAMVSQHRDTTAAKPVFLQGFFRVIVININGYGRIGAITFI